MCLVVLKMDAKKIKSGNGDQKKRDLELLEKWVNERVAVHDAPRVPDVLRYAKREGLKVTRKDVSLLVRLNKYYAQSMHQQRPVKKSKKYRPVVATNLGHLHADIGFISITSRLKYPVRPIHRGGFFVAVDVLSRFVYIVELKFNRQAPSIIKALEEILVKHKKAGNDYPIRSISFDQEKSVVGKKVQDWLKDHNIKFHSFEMTASKSKFAENMIGRIRSYWSKLNEKYNFEKPWWDMILETERHFNKEQPIIVDGKYVGNYTPDSINQSNIQEFLKSLQGAAPAYYWAQFNIDPSNVKFEFKIGDFVRAKLIVVSSAVIGEKRSERHLTDQVYKIIRAMPYVRRNMSIGKLYTCQNIEDPYKVEHFDQEDLQLTTNDRTAEDQ